MSERKGSIIERNHEQTTIEQTTDDHSSSTTNQGMKILMDCSQWNWM